jgi:hypothetical protein
MESRSTLRLILSGLLGVFALYFVWQAGFFFLDFTPGLLGDGFISWPQLSYPIMGVVLGILFIALAIYFGRSAIQVVRLPALAAKTAANALGRLLVLCILYLAHYYVVFRPQVERFSESDRAPIIPWLAMFSTVAVAGGFLYSRRLAGKTADRDVPENAG